jgi:endonuclease-3 related protein
MRASTRSVVLSGWRRIPGPPRDPTKGRLLRLYRALERRFGLQRGSPGSDPLKARRLRDLTRRLVRRSGGHFRELRRAPLPALRAELSRVPGLGRETVDAILLYEANRPVFVADAYTRRVLARHRLMPPRAGYEAARTFLEAHLPSDPALFRELHALLVAVGREHCRTSPRCATCPLRGDLRGRKPRL